MSSGPIHPAVESLGWTPYFHQQFLALASDAPELESWLPERVVAVQRGEYALLGAAGARRAVLAGRLLSTLADDERPCVGDFVLATPGPCTELSRIEHVFERMSLFRRKAAGPTARGQPVAANVDMAIVVSAFAPEDGDQRALRHALNARRIERYLWAIAEAPARAIVAVSKADLRSDAAEHAAELSRELGNIEVLLLSALTGEGVESLKGHIGPGVTAVFTGASGVGKSSLINGLLGRAAQRVEGIREDDARGRHTTTHRELFALPDGGMLIDTPGMRELGLFADDATDGRRTGFDDIDELAAGCRFRDCRHEDEPGCAVQKAVKQGELSALRLEHARKLRREIQWQKQRQALQQRRAERQKRAGSSRATRTGNYRDGDE